MKIIIIEERIWIMKQRKIDFLFFSEIFIRQINRKFEISIKNQIFKSSKSIKDIKLMIVNISIIEYLNKLK